MTILYILLGAALIFAGVLSGALADRIRGVRLVRAPAEHRRALRADRVAPEATGPERVRVSMAKEVTTALTQMGYAKEEATAAVNACTSSESSTLEAWIRAALKQTMKRAV